ncbi:pro-pol polyprotein [Plakobranchus ocellatus]|uniref:Pro-pol polyprotein n=1 Tax=Plakobranchus ocellatus TaxID=259542 RepID=A0AAV4BBW7_9GAST|nr:pro-pol polyprotein [Plakobranchus ocellatus]
MSASTVVRCFCQLFSLFGMPQYIHSDRGSNFMSSELKDFLHSKGIATSHTTPYNPRGNGQVERLNGTLWKTITLALKSSGLRIDEWELVLLDSLHSLRSLLSTPTSETPHERIFRYNRKSTTGTSLPSWVTTPGTVLMRRNVRPSKFDPFVDEVELLDCNPQYARVRTQDGKEQTVALRHLAPAGNEVAHHHNPDTVSRDTGSYMKIVSPPAWICKPILHIQQYKTVNRIQTYQQIPLVTLVPTPSSQRRAKRMYLRDLNLMLSQPLLLELGLIT